MAVMISVTCSMTAAVILHSHPYISEPRQLAGFWENNFIYSCFESCRTSLNIYHGCKSALWTNEIAL